MTNDENEQLQNGRRSIRDIPIPRRRAAAPRATDDVRPTRAPALEPEDASTAEEEQPRLRVVEEEVAPPRRAPEPPRREEAAESHLPPARSYRAERSRRSRFGWKKLVFFAVIVAGGFWLATWHSATVTVAQKHVEKDVSLTLPVSIGSTATGTLPAKAVAVTARAEKSLPATGEATVQSKAGGTITIVNEYSADEQTLVKNTRFETPDGLIFRIQDAVTIPGKTSAGGGTVEARVLADGVGERYNIGPVARFSVPGFAGKPQFDGFYARSDSAMTGGFDGVQKVADPDLVADAIDQLTEDLRGRMDQEAAADAGAGHRAFTVPGSFQVLGSGREPKGDTVTVWVEAGADAYAVSESDFADAVASAILTGYRAKGEATIDSPDALRVTPKEGASPALEIVGRASVTWAVNADSLRATLLGQPSTAFNQVITEFGGVARADQVIRPFWRSAFPTDSSRVEVVMSTEEIDA